MRKMCVRGEKDVIHIFFPMLKEKPHTVFGLVGLLYREFFFFSTDVPIPRPKCDQIPGRFLWLPAFVLIFYGDLDYS
jgi:hypothetical protein